MLSTSTSWKEQDGWRRPVEKSRMVNVDSTFHGQNSTFYDLLYGKKYYLINLDKMKFFLFLKILSSLGTFGINTLIKSLCQKYLKNSKFWKIKKISLHLNLEIHLSYLVDVDRWRRPVEKCSLPFSTSWRRRRRLPLFCSTAGSPFHHAQIALIIILRKI